MRKFEILDRWPGKSQLKGKFLFWLEGSEGTAKPWSFKKMWEPSALRDLSIWGESSVHKIGLIL